jgi:hypothetical protein
MASFSTDTLIALITANTASPSLRFIRFTEPVVIIDVTIPNRGSDDDFRHNFVRNDFLNCSGKRFRISIDLRERSSDIATMSAVEYD